MPDVFAHPRQGLVSNCVRSTPVDARGHLGTLCGLAYPYQRGYPQGSANTLSPPAGQVFDEIYFATDAHIDLLGLEHPGGHYAYFDPEPPLAKLMIAGGEWGWGWFRATFQGARGDIANLGFNPFGWRIMACLVGTLCVPLMYLLAHRLWRNRVFAVAAALMTCLDGLFFVQSRIGMIDIFPIFLILLAYWLFTIHLQSRTARASLITLLLTGTVVGLGIAAKWIVLAVWATIVFLLVLRVLWHRIDAGLGGEAGTGSRRAEAARGPAIPGGARWGPYLIVAAVALVLVPAVIYVASWTPFFVRGQFHTLADLWHYNVQAYIYHATLKATHPYGSKWYTWPFLIRPVAYYFQGSGLGIDQWTGRPLVAGIVDLGNPWIWWTSLPCLVAMPYFAIRHRSYPAAFICVAFVTSYLPWTRVSRVLFLYHMFGSLPFMILALAFVLARVHASSWHGWEVGFTRLRLLVTGRRLVYAHLLLVVAFFVFLYPIWTGLPIGDLSYLSGFPHGKMWLRSWI
ncbi:MAG: phospholipid carrier-dependent glycosyltransferase [Candidatus Dormibacteraceae bacterium]